MRNVLLFVLLLGLVACGSTPATGNTTGTGATALPTETSTAGAAPSAAATLAAANGVEVRVAQELGRQLQIQSATLRLVSKEDKEWPDAALGCPKMGVMYIQVVTPGLLLHYTDGTKQYEVHADKSGSHVVVCSGGHPLTTP